MSRLHVLALFSLPCLAALSCVVAGVAATRGQWADVIFYGGSSACLVGVWAGIVDDVAGSEVSR